MTDIVTGGTAPLILSALFGPADFVWLDGLRRAHFPPERNVIAAHLTLFHHLPPSVAGEVERKVAEICRAGPPSAVLSEPMTLGRGVALRVRSPELAAIRAELADAFAPMLTPQDGQGWRAHVTIQNKVAPDVARALLAEMKAGWRERPLAITGLAGWWYRDGPWEPAFRRSFRG